MYRFAFFALCVLVSLPVTAQSYPSKPIRFVVPFPPGGGTDVVGRLVALHLSETIGQQVVVDNRSGAQGNIGTALVAKAAPDGYTVVITSAIPFAINPWLYKDIGYDSVRDFAQIMLATEQPHVITVTAGLPVNTVAELIAVAKSRPGQIRYASTGSAGQLAGELLMQMTSTRIIHIPYKGAGQAIIDLLGGHVDMMFASPVTAIEHARSGRIRAIAVTSRDRLPTLPQVPSIKEAGLPDLQISSWYGFAAPAATPKPIIAKLNAEMVKALRAEKVRTVLLASGLTPVGNSPAEMTAFLKSEHERWGKVVRSSSARIE